MAYDLLYYIKYIYGRTRFYIQPLLYNDFNANEILPRIYLGGVGAAYSYTELKDKGVTHIISALLGFGEIYPGDFVYKTYHLQDETYEDIFKHFNDCSDYIHETLKNPEHRVLIHCMQGISRSTSLLVAYMIKYHHIKVDDAINYIKLNRPIIKPNDGFREQLITYNNLYISERKKLRATI